MTPRSTADEKLERVLHVLPAAAREEGASLDELAEELGVRRARVLRDLEEVTARAFYHRSGEADRLQIAVDDERVSVWTAGEFERPVKLSSGETLALDLALRARAAADGDAPPGEAVRLARALQRDLAVAAPARPGAIAVEGERPRADGEPDADGAEAAGGSGDVVEEAAGGWAGDVRSVLFRAARERRCCSVRYLASGAEEPSDRTLAPYAVVYARGHWYVLAARPEDDEPDVRIYRADRALDARLLEDGFEVPDEFDPADFLTEGRPYRADDPVHTTVRYSARVAPWIREKGPVEEHEDGSVTVVHSVSDPDWLVRHVLRYGPEAEVLEPSEMRRRVAEAARRTAETYREAARTPEGAGDTGDAGDAAHAEDA